MDEDYRVNFSIKSALERYFQPKSERLISKISTASEHKPEQDDDDNHVSGSRSTTTSLNDFQLYQSVIHRSEGRLGEIQTISSRTLERMD